MKISQKIVITEVCAVFNLTEKQLLSRDRRREFAEPRFMAMYFLKIRNPSLSMFEIAILLGCTSHCSVVHGLKRFKELEEVDKNFADKMNKIQAQLDLSIDVFKVNNIPQF